MGKKPYVLTVALAVVAGLVGGMVSNFLFVGTPVFAQMEEGVSPGPGPLVSFTPLLVFSLVVGIQAAFIAKRKVKSVRLYFFLGSIPLFGFLAISYLVSLTDKEVYDKLNKILEYLEKR